MNNFNFTYNSNVINVLNQFKPPNVLVIGDAMIDRYHHGTVNRISQEAPIPVLLVNREEDRLGGAAAVANNLSSLGCKVSLSALTGNDENHDKFIDLLSRFNIDHSLIQTNPKFKTILKTRYVAQNQQLVRVDYENNFQLSEKNTDIIANKIVERLNEFDVVVISDYDKGFLHPNILNKVINHSNYLNIPCICDPKNNADFSIYKGVTIIKPNRVEAEAFTNIKISNKNSLLTAAKKIKTIANSKYVCISVDRDGIFYYNDNSNYFLFPTESKDVYDVSGAGDMVTSILAAFYHKLSDPKLLFPIANIAASIVISKLGTVTATIENIKNVIYPYYFHKIIEIDRLISIRNNDKINIWTFTNGYFDNITSSHIKFLSRAAQFGDVRVVAINSDNSIFKSKNKKPILNQFERAELLTTLHNVDWVVIFDSLDAREIMKKLKPDIIIKGANFKNKKIVEQDIVNNINAKLVFIDISI